MYPTMLPIVHVAKLQLASMLVPTHSQSLIANKSMELLCIDFLKVDQSWDGKENVLVLTDAFSKFSQVFVTPKQKALTIANVLVDKWFYVYSIPTWIHSDKGHSFENDILTQLHSMYGIKQSTTTPYNSHGNSICEWFNCTLLNFAQTITQRVKIRLAFTCSISCICLQCHDT